MRGCRVCVALAVAEVHWVQSVRNYCVIQWLRCIKARSLLAESSGANMCWELADLSNYTSNEAGRMFTQNSSNTPTLRLGALTLVFI